MQTTPPGDVFKSTTALIVGALERGIVPWKVPWSAYGPPKDAISKDTFTGTNLWLLLSLGYQEHLFVNREDVHDRGMVVKPDAEAVQLFPFPDLNPCAPPHQVSVYNVAQLIGFPKALWPEREEQFEAPLTMCDHLLTRMRERPLIRVNCAESTYHLNQDLITIAPKEQFPSGEEYFQCIFRLLIYSTGHPKRLARHSAHYVVDGDGMGFTFEELVGELGSAFLCSLMQVTKGLPQSTDAYRNGWTDRIKGTKYLFSHASHEAEQAVSHLLHHARRKTCRTDS
jgi:antirestriction protein ArdC